MSTVTTYDSLVNDIVAYCERSDEPFLSQVPRFIALAEQKIASESKPLGFLRTVNGVMNGRVLSKPTRWRKTKSISYTKNGRIEFLFNRAYDYCMAYWPEPALTGAPEYYADYDFEHLIFVPTPDEQYPIEVQYYELPEPLSTANQTNWTTQYAPQLLLFGSLEAAQTFLKTPERIPEFQGSYDRAMSAIKTEDASRVTDDATVRS